MVSNIAVFVHVKALHSFFSGYIVILQIDHKEANARSLQKCVQAQGGKKKRWNHSLSLMMSTQRQWGAALISVTCPCASHQLHYGSISHASSAN